MIIIRLDHLKKNTEETIQKYKNDVQWTSFPNLYAQNNARSIYMPLNSFNKSIKFPIKYE